MSTVATNSFTNIAPLYLLRVMHIGSMMAISYKVIHDYILDVISTENSSIFAFAGIFLMVSGTILFKLGFINTFLLKPKKMG